MSGEQSLEVERGISVQDALREKIENILDERVRPVLHGHDGEIRLLDFQDGVLTVRMTGECGCCPAAVITNETLIEKEICAAAPEVERVSLAAGVSDSLLDEAREILARPCRRKAQ